MSDLRDDKTETGCDLRTALEAERAAVGVGSSRIKHINSRLTAMHTPEVIASLQHRVMEIESPSGPTPQDAQREAIARIIDPRAFIIVNPKRIDMTDRQRWAREKADAILALQTRAGG